MTWKPLRPDGTPTSYVVEMYPLRGLPSTWKKRTQRERTEQSGKYQYVCVNGRRVAAHRLIMARLIGRPLTRNEHVHHINEVRNDNRPENLYLCTKGEHQEIHDRIIPG